jgi:two-component system, cell cycle sensor histidine kinase and response regulator CckA
VLLIEDNLAEARLLQELLKGAMLNRFQLVHAKRLGEAIALLQGAENAPEAEAFQVILLDLTLPDSAGLPSLDLLIQHAPQLPIVVLTNTNDDELAVAAVRHGAQDYLVKRHVKQDLLVRSVRYAIERKQSAEALREVNETLELRVQERTAELATANYLLTQEIEQRQKTQERLELAQQAGKIGTFEWQIPTYTLTWTAALEALYGLEPGGFDGQFETWMQTLHPDDRPHIEPQLWQAIQHSQGLETEFRITLPQGETRWIAVKGSIFSDSASNPLRMIGIHMDITEKKQLEAQFLRAQRLESLGTLASGIAHDLNNILTPILAIAQLLPLKFPQLDEHTRQMLTMLETSAHRGSDLIKQILAFARGAEGKRVGLQVSHLLVEIERIIDQTLPKSITININIPNDLWLICGDATQLHQVFMNLCVNARDAMPQGGTLGITATNVLVDEAYARKYLDASAGLHVMISVTDTGAGIPAHVLPHIFDPFFTTKEVGKGTGLGLSAVLGIVKSHGGFVDVQSEVNQGSQFKIYLPANPSHATPLEDDLTLLIGRQELILVVDDEATVCEVIKTALETYNYRVLTAKDGLEAIARYAEHQDEIRTVLIDLMMPTMDGLTTIPLLRQLNPDVQIITMSGLTATEPSTQVNPVGSQYFLPKPLQMRELLSKLAELTQVHST